MKGRIKEILPPSLSKNGKNYYIRARFFMLDGDRRYAHVDVVIGFKNYDNWESLLKVGNIIGGLRYWGKSPVAIDADSEVYLVEEVTT